jgi:energy-coupling factor transporter ATP-binding protein EcfA2/GNAT superfamily N-acetyltransferase
MNIELKSKILNDKYTEYVYEHFDIQNTEETNVSIPMNLDGLNSFEWNIGVIYGGSGSGKSSIINHLGGVREVIFDEDKPLISNFNWIEPEEATRVLTAIGLSSVPTWLRPYKLLSNGEQYRAMLAYLVASSKDGETILIDEYTSVVDRDVAKAMSFALQKYIRRENKKIILASCHFDIMEWLMPDWTYSPMKGGGIEKPDYLRQGRPEITLSISRVEAETWNFFKKHHYLTEEANRTYIYLLFEWNDKPVAINVIGRHLGTTGGVPGYRGSRVVVHPDYQGMGIGSKISEFSAGIIKNRGGRYYTKTINPALGEYRNKNTHIWKPTPFNGKLRVNDNEHSDIYKTIKQRASYCHEYIGEGVYGFDELLKPVEELRGLKRVNNEVINKFFSF